VGKKCLVSGKTQRGVTVYVRRVGKISRRGGETGREVHQGMVKNFARPGVKLLWGGCFIVAKEPSEGR